MVAKSAVPGPVAAKDRNWLPPAGGSAAPGGYGPTRTRARARQFQIEVEVEVANHNPIFEFRDLNSTSI
jgi:hypothetical protein